MMFTLKGQAVRSPIKDVSVVGRATQGVKLVNLSDKDELIGISKVIASEEDETGSVDEDNPEQVQEAVEE